MTKPITKRAKEVLLNILERRNYKARWMAHSKRWATPSAMGGASRRLLDSLRVGGYVDPHHIRLTEAGVAVAEAYKQHLIRRHHPAVMPGFTAIGTTGPLKDEAGHQIGGRCVVFVKDAPPSTRDGD